MALPTSFYAETLGDNTQKSNGAPETGNWRVPVTTITAGNYTTITGKIATLHAAVAAINIGVYMKSQVESEVFKATAPVPSGNALSQRENKYLCRYHDSINGQKFSVSIPCADLSVHATNSEFIDLGSGVGATLKAAFEDVVVSPNNSSNAVVLDSVQFVGRAS